MRPALNAIHWWRASPFLPISNTEPRSGANNPRQAKRDRSSATANGSTSLTRRDVVNFYRSALGPKQCLPIAGHKHRRLRALTLQGAHALAAVPAQNVQRPVGPLRSIETSELE